MMEDKEIVTVVAILEREPVYTAPVNDKKQVEVCPWVWYFLQTIFYFQFMVFSAVSLSAEDQILFRNSGTAAYDVMLLCSFFVFLLLKVVAYKCIPQENILGTKFVLILLNLGSALVPIGAIISLILYYPEELGSTYSVILLGSLFLIVLFLETLAIIFEDKSEEVAEV